MNVLKLVCVTLITLVSTSVLAIDPALSLKNLERERAALINDLLSPSLMLQERLNLLNKRQQHLTDMERMVMRDERLLNSDSTIVMRAFNEYETTFLVHAGAEKSLSAAQQWLDQVNFNNEAILNARVGFRK
ncbi:hypothetical protein [Glaciecola petra]|uniref:Uncharacterized protein n=1 Tax=Glaciecola petra TaxID=3075602 RepID=A0ABU2ZN66_9ALTE|nr:hypothetical protein [Aestuariibacter sp. P117]MDT0594059.1 hypothetical protein [Aestuariibacter sp. P117]